jgi:hypothetical protein
LSVVRVVYCQVESLRLADQASRGFLPNVVRRCVLSRNLKNEEALAHCGGGGGSCTKKKQTDLKVLELQKYFLCITHNIKDRIKQTKYLDCLSYSQAFF